MAIIGAIMLFIYQIYIGSVYGQGGLSYITITGAIFALATAISVGSGGAFDHLTGNAVELSSLSGYISLGIDQCFERVNFYPVSEPARSDLDYLVKARIEARGFRIKHNETG